MSRCKLRTPWPIHFKLRTAIGIDSLTVCMLFGEISIFHSRVMGKKVFTNKYCMNVDDRHVMGSWHSCLFKKVVNWIGNFFFISICKKMREKHLNKIKENKQFFSYWWTCGFVHTCKNCLKIICFYKSYILFN